MIFLNEILTIYISFLLKQEDPYKILSGVESYQNELLSHYHRLVKQGNLEPIEKIGNSEKSRIKEIEKKYHNKGTMESRINFCRVVWLVDRLS